MQFPDPTHPTPITVPVRIPNAPTGTTAQQAFRQAILAVDNLRAQLRDLRTAQAEARRRYWQQVGPVATAVVAARRALFLPLEEALLLVYFSRLEEQQLTQLILGNARALEERFGEETADIIRKYAPTDQRTAGRPGQPTPPDATPSTFVPDPSLPPHEQAAAAARARRRSKAQRQQEAAALADQQQLEASAKTIYRQLARTHHPDLHRDPDQQAHRTALMQRITEAYEADDLFALLELLAESGPTDADSDTVLARYTQVLLQQQAHLKQEMNELKYGPGSLAFGSGKKQEAELRLLKRHLRAEAEYLQQVLASLRTPSDLRDLLRQLAAEGLESF